MNSLLSLLQTAWAERIGWTVLHSVWQVAAVAAAFAVGAWLLQNRSAAARYALGCVSLLAMVIASTVTFLALPASQSPPALATFADPDANPPATIEVTPVEALPAGAARRPSIATSQAWPGRLLLDQNTIRDPESLRTDRSDSLRRGIDAVLPWITAGWLLGTAVFSLRLLVGLQAVRRLRTLGIGPVPIELAHLARRIAVRLGISHSVQVAQSLLVEVPTVIGYLRPVILLPVSALTLLRTEELELLIAHELAHVRRRDYLVNLLQALVETVLFFHPAMWWVSRQVRQERENCCDDLAIATCGRRELYVRTLWKVEQQRQPIAPAMAAAGGSLAGRIRRLLTEPPATQHTYRGSAWLAGVVGVAMIAVLATFGQTLAENDEASPAGKQESAAPQNATLAPEKQIGGSVVARGFSTLRGFAFRAGSPSEDDAPLGPQTVSNAPAQPETGKQPVEKADADAAKVNEGRPWIAEGRVTDVDGKPLAGVTIDANAGIGSLARTGSATTDADGRYRLRFGPGILIDDDKAVQSATLFASKPGYFERNLCRQGDCRAAMQKLEKAADLWGATADKLFLPGEPKTIDFVMQPAARLDGEFVESSHNWNVREQYFYVVGQDLPPSSGVLTSVTSDRRGRFHIDAIPTDRAWRIGMRVPHTGLEIETAPLRFDKPGQYRCKLVLEAKTSDGGAVKLSLRVEGLERELASDAADANQAAAELVPAIDRLDAQGFSQLHNAAMAGRAAEVRQLLAQGASVEVRQAKFRGTPLQYAAHNGHTEIVKALLEHQAAVDARDANSRTPLIWAAMEGRTATMGLLLDAGAHIDATNEGGWTPLHYAVSKGHREAAQLLLDRGANVQAENSQGKTPIDLAPSLDLKIPWKSVSKNRSTKEP